MGGVHLHPPATEATIKAMQKAARRDLGEPVPKAFTKLLRMTNGLQINGAYFESAEHLVLDNIDLSRPEIILLGNAGNVDQYVYDKRDRKFHTIHMGFPNERYASFDTFEELLNTVLREQQVLRPRESS
jgi:hypothetical protein